MHRRPPSSLWADDNFLLFWSGQTVSVFGSAVTTVALPLTAILLLKASTFEISLLTSAATVSYLLISLPAGVMIDRIEKRRLMVWCDIGRMLALGSVPVAAVLRLLSMGHLYVIAFISGSFSVIFEISYQGYVPDLVGREKLTDGNSKLASTNAVSKVIGPGIAGVLVGLLGAATAIAVDAGSYVFSFLSLMLIRSPGARRSAATPKRREPAARRMGAEIVEGLRFVVRTPALRSITACTATANLFIPVAMSLQVLFLVRVLHVRPTYTGLLIGIGSSGGVVAGLVSPTLGRRIGAARIIWLAILVFGMTGLLVPLAYPGWRLALFPVGWAGFNFTTVIYNISQLTYRQAICPPELLGRMNAAVRWIVWGVLPFGGLLGGVLGANLGIRPALWVAFTGSWAAGFLVFFSPLRRMRNFPDPTVDKTSVPEKVGR
jgi:MFS family permease